MAAPPARGTAANGGNGINGSRPGVSPLVSVLIAAGGVILGITGAFILLGGSLRQVDVDSHRIEQIEIRGSPHVAVLEQQINTINTRMDSLRALALELPKVDLVHAVQLAELHAQVVELQAAKIDIMAKIINLLDRLARAEQTVSQTESRVSRNEQRAEQHQAEEAASVQHDLEDLRARQRNAKPP